MGGQPKRQSYRPTADGVGVAPPTQSPIDGAGNFKDIYSSFNVRSRLFRQPGRSRSFSRQMR